MLHGLRHERADRQRGVKKRDYQNEGKDWRKLIEDEKSLVAKLRRPREGLREALREILNRELNPKAPYCADGDYYPMYEDNEIYKVVDQLLALLPDEQEIRKEERERIKSELEESAGNIPSHWPYQFSHKKWDVIWQALSQEGE